METEGPAEELAAVKQDLLDVFWLLYPMLAKNQQQTSEARKAAVIADKYDPRRLLRRAGIGGPPLSP